MMQRFRWQEGSGKFLTFLNVYKPLTRVNSQNTKILKACKDSSVLVCVSMPFNTSLTTGYVRGGRVYTTYSLSIPPEQLRIFILLKYFPIWKSEAFTPFFRRGIL